jgi:hypothetical protein
MATCAFCNQEMLLKVSCPGNAPDLAKCGDTPIPYTGDGHCHDCSAPPGGFHHPGCDMERCPRCRGQIISCGCYDEESVS